MWKQNIHLAVYGAEKRCASCVNSPGAKETFEWLQAAISRKYGEQGVTYQYFDIDKQALGADPTIIERIFKGELFYPLVVVEGVIVGEGNPSLKKIYYALESLGLREA